MDLLKAVARKRAWLFVPAVLVIGGLALLAWLSGDPSSPGVYPKF